jgi:hypothetical protein
MRIWYRMAIFAERPYLTCGDLHLTRSQPDIGTRYKVLTAWLYPRRADFMRGVGFHPEASAKTTGYDTSRKQSGTPGGRRC